MDNDAFLTSASQVSTYELCVRKWAWRYIDGIKAPPSPYADFGLITHAHIAEWLKKRIPPEGDKPAKLAQMMLLHLPPPQEVHPDNVECEFEIWFGKIGFMGDIDLWLPSGDIPIIHDHKTTRDFDWALTPQTLLSDVQATIYAAWALTKTKKPVVELRWIYGKRGTTKVLPVIQHATTHAIERRLKQSIQSAQEMRLIKASGKTAIELPYDAAGCEALGGCPYQDRCNLSPQERLESIMSQGLAKNALLEKLKSHKSSNGAEAAVNPPEAAGANKLLEKKQRGRPKKQPEVVEAAATEVEPTVVPSSVPESMQWSVFVGHIMPALLSRLPDEELLSGDTEISNLVSKVAAGFADELMVQHRSRFGG